MKRPSASRRTFLQGGIALAASSALPGFRVMRSAHAATGVPRTLIVIHLAGGNDTLNTVVPYTNPDYYAARKLLAVPAAQVLPLNAQQGLHPALTGIKALYDASKVAIVNGVGYPTFDYSHFQAMQIYWTADPTQLTTTGWLGRSLDAAVAGASAPDILTGRRHRLGLAELDRPLVRLGGIAEQGVPFQAPGDGRSPGGCTIAHPATAHADHHQCV